MNLERAWILLHGFKSHLDKLSQFISLSFILQDSPQREELKLIREFTTDIEDFPAIQALLTKDRNFRKLISDELDEPFKDLEGYLKSAKETRKYKQATLQAKARAFLKLVKNLKKRITTTNNSKENLIQLQPTLVKINDFETDFTEALDL